MNKLCRITEDAIWDSVREGISLPDEVARHVEHCPECAGTLQQVRSTMHLLHGAGQVDEVPDPGQIALPSTQAGRYRVPGWALAMCILCLLGLTLSLRKTPTPVITDISVKRPVPPSHVVSVPKKFTEEVPPISNTRITHLKTAPVQRGHHPVHVARIYKPASAPVKPIIIAKKALPPVPVKKVALVVPRQDNTPIRIVYTMKPTDTNYQPDKVVSTASISWSRLETNHYSYSSRVEDSETGSYLEEYVERSGNNIRIEMRSNTENNSLSEQNKERG